MAERLRALRRVRIAEREDATDVLLREDGTIAAVRAADPGPAARDELDAGGRVAIPSPVDAHVHLDKAFVLDRLGPLSGGLTEAIGATEAIKQTFTATDILARAEALLTAWETRGVRAARVHVEIDPVVGLRGVEAHLELRERWADRIELQLVAFPQEGALRAGTGALLDAALALGCDVVGACPYADDDQDAAIDDAFRRAERTGKPLDLHLDFADDPAVHFVDRVCDQAVAHGMQGRVVVGHLTSLAAMTREDAGPRIAALAGAGIGVIALPTTDLYLGGREAERLAPRGLTRVLELIDGGVRVALASNNHQNAFTPVQTPDPLRLAWLTMLVAHVPPARWADMLACVTTHPAAMLGLAPAVIAPGGPATMLVLDAHAPQDAILAVPPTWAQLHDGRLTRSASHA